MNEVNEWELIADGNADDEIVNAPPAVQYETVQIEYAKTTTKILADVEERDLALRRQVQRGSCLIGYAILSTL